MAFPVIPEEMLDKFPTKETKEKVKETVVAAASKISTGTASILDFLLILIVATLYYFFTGLAIVLNRNIPYHWLRLGTHLGMKKVSSIVKNASQNALQKAVATKNAPKRVFKVVDIDTKRPLKVLKVNK